VCAPGASDTQACASGYDSGAWEQYHRSHCRRTGMQDACTATNALPCLCQPSRHSHYWVAGTFSSRFRTLVQASFQLSRTSGGFCNCQSPRASRGRRAVRATATGPVTGRRLLIDKCAADCATSSIDAAQLQGSGSGLWSGGLGVQPPVQSATAGSGAALAGGGAAAAEDGKPCDYAELRFGTGRACANYVAGQLHYASRAVGTLTAEIVVAIPVFGCEPLANAPAVVGKLVLVERGTCGFVAKSGQRWQS
jgi:hypothetical protein